MQKCGGVMKTFTNSTTINELISNAMDKLKTIVDSSTIVGEQIKTEEGTIIVPISKVAVGFVVGGGEYADLSSRRVANHFPMSGGSSGGMTVSPVGFLIIQADGKVDFVNVENKTLYQTIVNLVNTILRKIDEDNNNDISMKNQKAKEGEDEEK